MALEAMIIKSAITWIISAAIASLIAFVTMEMHSSNRIPCADRKCYAQLDTRLAVIEAEMKVRTADRYTGADAKRDLLIINRRIDAIHAGAREQKQ
jgi:hypothetical protein